MSLRTGTTGSAAVVALALVAAVALTACGSSDSPEVANVAESETAEEESSTTEPSEDPEEALLAYTQCMREEGIDLPDPDFTPAPEGEEGGGRFEFGLGGADPNDPDFQAAQEKCQPNLQAMRGSIDPEEREALEDAALEFARCMREKGFDVPDPEFSEGGGGGMLFGPDANLDPEDPETRAAMDECREDAGLGNGPGGGPFQGDQEQDG